MSDLSSDLRASLLLEALRPFAEAAEQFDPRPGTIPPLDDNSAYPSGLDVADYRRARTAIQQVEGK